MIGNKYGKVIILALINILALCFVYNNVATDKQSSDTKQSGTKSGWHCSSKK